MDVVGSTVQIPSGSTPLMIIIGDVAFVEGWIDLRSPSNQPEGGWFPFDGEPNKHRGFSDELHQLQADMLHGILVNKDGS